MEALIPEKTIPRMGYYLYKFCRFTVVSIIVGLVVGILTTVFGHLLLTVTDFRTANPWVIWLLPFAGLLIVFFYNITNTRTPRGTNLVIEAVRSEDRIPAKMAPLIFVSTVLTHLFGGSAGREGAALQLGGSIGHLIGDIFKTRESKKHILVMCGMSAAFSALFGTPLAATVFALELANIGIMCYSALVPCTVSAIIAYSIAQHSGLPAERFHIEEIPFTVTVTTGVIVLGILCAGLSILFCASLERTSNLSRRFIPNPYLRAFTGGLLVIAMTYIFQTRDYLGSGINIIEDALQGETVPEAFILKLLFTAATLSFGFKGGEIIPTLFVGATFGSAISGFLGMDPHAAAAIGMIAMFCGVTNCPLTSLLLACEVFGFVSPQMFLLGLAVSYMLSGYYSLYSSQKIVHSKTHPVVINRTAH
ncbi:chloride channel protein [Oscillospiraceae bacterium LTW-04]|nr:chloride channel protein [Oscillospiraceae bacterium MB24-C1]